MRTFTPSPAPSGNRGFTFLEMLAVLAVITVLAAFSWPSVRRQLDSHRLRTAAKSLRAELRRTRQKAVETGQIQVFRYLVDDRRFQVTGARFAMEPSQDDPKTTRLDRDEREDPAVDSAEAEATEGELPEGVTFLDPAADMPWPKEPDEDATVEPARADSVELVQPVERVDARDEPDLVDADQWSAAIVFFPNGRAASARLRIGDASGRWIDVKLRGLTGIATIGPMRRGEVRP